MGKLSCRRADSTPTTQAGHTFPSSKDCNLDVSMNKVGSWGSMQHEGRRTEDSPDPQICKTARFLSKCCKYFVNRSRTTTIRFDEFARRLEMMLDDIRVGSLAGWGRGFHESTGSGRWVMGQGARAGHRLQLRVWTFVSG